MKRIFILAFFAISINLKSQTYFVKYSAKSVIDSTIRKFDCEVYFADTIGFIQFSDSVKSCLMLVNKTKCITISNNKIISADTFISIENSILKYLGISIPFNLKDSIIFFNGTKTERLRKLNFKKSFFKISRDLEGFHCLKYKNVILSLSVYANKNSRKASFHYNKSSFHYRRSKGKQKQLLRLINQFY